MHGILLLFHSLTQKAFHVSTGISHYSRAMFWMWHIHIPVSIFLFFPTGVFLPRTAWWLRLLISFLIDLWADPRISVHSKSLHNTSNYPSVHQQENKDACCGLLQQWIPGMEFRPSGLTWAPSLVSYLFWVFKIVYFGYPDSLMWWNLILLVPFLWDNFLYPC